MLISCDTTHLNMSDGFTSISPLSMKGRKTMLQMAVNEEKAEQIDVLRRFKSFSALI